MKLAFGGKMGCGKDTSVDYLISKHGGRKLSFSNSLYDILYYAQKICGFPLQKDRKFLQFVGTDWARSINENVWIDLTIKKAKEMDFENLYITDVRFKNELESLKKDGWICVKITRTEHLKNREGTGDIKHESEISLDSIPDGDWDIILNNDGTLEQFYESIDKKIKIL
jgi:hypothetical protein